MRPLLLLILLVLLCADAAWAHEAEGQLGTWTGANSTIRFTKRWSGFVQGELRTWEFYENLNEFLARFAAHYDLSKKSYVGLGYLRADSWGFDAMNTHPKRGENRLYQQFDYKHDWGRADIEHRYRQEQRWITEAGSTRHSNRGRYMFQALVPVNCCDMRGGAWYLSGRNEFFFNFEGSFFDQNRFFVGGGKQFTDSSRIEAGLLWLRRPDVDYFRIQITYVHNFDVRKRRRRM